MKPTIYKSDRCSFIIDLNHYIPLKSFEMFLVIIILSKQFIKRPGESEIILHQKFDLKWSLLWFLGL